MARIFTCSRFGKVAMGLEKAHVQEKWLRRPLPQIPSRRRHLGGALSDGSQQSLISQFSGIGAKVLNPALGRLIARLLQRMGQVLAFVVQTESPVCQPQHAAAMSALTG